MLLATGEDEARHERNPPKRQEEAKKLILIHSLLSKSNPRTSAIRREDRWKIAESRTPELDRHRGASSPRLECHSHDGTDGGSLAVLDENLRRRSFAAELWQETNGLCLSLTGALSG